MRRIERTCPDGYEMKSGVCIKKIRHRGRVSPIGSVNPFDNQGNQNYRLDCCDDAMDEAAYCNGVHTSSHSSGCCSCTQVSYPMDFLGQGFQMYYICNFTCMGDLVGCCGGGGSRAGFSGGRAGGAGRFNRKGGRIRRRR